MVPFTNKKRGQSAIEDETSASPKFKRLRAEAIAPTRRLRKRAPHCSQTSTKNPVTAGNRLSAISQPELVSRGTQTSAHVNIRSNSSSPTLIGSITSHSIGISNSRSPVAGDSDHDSMANSIDDSCISSALVDFSQAYEALSDTTSNETDSASSSSGSSTKTIDRALGALNHASDVSSLSTDSTSSSGISSEDDSTESGPISQSDLVLTRHIHPHGRKSLHLASRTSISTSASSLFTDSSQSSSSSSSSSESSTSDSNDSVSLHNLNSELSAITNDPPPPYVAALSSTPQLTTANLTALQTGLNALHSRITTLLPMLQAANQTLETDRVEGRLAERDIENLADGEEAYIEMNLGFGVLEEQRRQEQPQSGIQLPNHYHEYISSGGSDDDDDDQCSKRRRSGSSSAATEKLLPKLGKKKNKRGNKEGEEDDVLARLMGRSKATKKRKPNIEVL